MNSEKLPAMLPEDEHNRKLVSNVHPADWVNPTPSGKYNLVVIGAGTAGLVTAAGAAGLGAKVALIERQFMGGDCLNVGCVPSKAIISSARASAPPIDGLDSVPYPTNETVFSLTELPKRLGIIGAGPIGCEMAQAFARLGCEVFLVASAAQILSKEDPEAAEIIRASLLRDGVKILCCGKELKLSPADDGVRMTVESEGRGYDLTVSRLLVAAGRAPNVEGLDLEKAGVEYSKKGVTIDDKFRTTNKRIFAAGDICSPYQFTHAADFMARAVIRNTLFFGRAKHSSLVIPWCTYTSPELAQIGLTTAEAEEKGVEIDTFSQPMRSAPSPLPSSRVCFAQHWLIAPRSVPGLAVWAFCGVTRRAGSCGRNRWPCCTWPAPGLSPTAAGPASTCRKDARPAGSRPRCRSPGNGPANRPGPRRHRDRNVDADPCDCELDVTLDLNNRTITVSTIVPDYDLDPEEF